MEKETKIHKIGGSYCIIIPANLAIFFGVDKLDRPRKCKIRDTDINTAEIIFDRILDRE